MKLRLILAALVAATALAACGGNEPAESKAGDAAPAQSEAQPAAQPQQAESQPAAQPAQAESQPATQPAAQEENKDGTPMAAEPKSEGEKQSD